MTARIIAIAVVLSLIGAGVVWLSRTIIQAERAEQLKRAVELVVERDKIDAKLKTATPADVCRSLGGQWLPDENECG